MVAKHTDSTYICDTLFSHELQNMFAALLVQGRTANNSLGYVQGECGVTLHFSSQKFFNLRRVVHVFFFAHCIRRYLDLRSFMFLGSPAKLIIVLCPRSEVREERLSSSFSACIKRNLGIYVFLVEKRNLIDLFEKLRKHHQNRSWIFSSSVFYFAD